MQELGFRDCLCALVKGGLTGYIGCNTMNRYHFLSKKLLLQELVRLNSSVSRAFARRMLPAWDNVTRNALGPHVGRTLSRADADPSNSPRRGVVVYLTRGRAGDLKQLARSLKLLRKHFLTQFPYPVIVFHEGDVDATDQSRLIAIAPERIRFEVVKFRVPEWLTEDRAKALPWRTGYCHMCDFFAGTIFENPAMAPFDWYWRLDIDSFLLTPIRYDLFAALDHNDLNYGYLTTFYEQEHVCQGLAEWVADLVQKERIVPTFLGKHVDAGGMWNRLSLYTNFEIGRLSFWRSEQYKRLWGQIKQSRGIYEKRWGDAPLHYIALSLFETETKIARITDVGYRHVNFFACPS